MGAFEYLLLLMAVILGLALSDLAVSLHRLLNAGRRIRWDVLTVLAAALAFVRIITQWWGLYHGDQIARGVTFAMFMGFLISGVLLFLMAAAALPDEIHGEEVDLGRHYWSISRRFWLIFAGQWCVMNGVVAWAQIRVLGAHVAPGTLLTLAIPLAAALMAFTRSRALHLVALGGVLIFYLASYSGVTLT